MAESVLFCPFCRDSFEGERICPEHELPLVPWERLPASESLASEALDSGAGSAADAEARQRLGLLELGYGRGLAGSGALLTTLAFFLPTLSMRGGREAVATMFELARGRAPALWIVPLGAAVVLLTLLRRRTAADLRGARLAVPIAALMPTLALALVLSGTRDAARALSSALGQTVTSHPELGAYLVWLALPLMLVGGLRLGVGPPR